MNNILKDKVILLTGGSGTFGNYFTEIVLKKYNPKTIRIYSRDEKKQYDMNIKFNKDKRIRFFIGDVRDKDRLFRAMNDVDIVVHAAALKQVLSCEYNPIEAVRTNIIGSINVIDAAIDNKVDRIISISTDKAVHPINLYGSTKMTAEKLFVQGNTYSQSVKTKFGIVRYGNVIGSRGSVIPLFLKQKEKGEITITDKNMTRFWIKPEEAIEFTIKCIGLLKGGEIFVPKLYSMKIIDLADIIAPDARKKFIGVGPGEKLHEILITNNESKRTIEFDDYYIIEPELPFWKGIKKSIGGKKLLEDFSYTSNNTKRITKEKILKIIKEIKL